MPTITWAIVKTAAMWIGSAALLYGGYRAVQNHFIGIDNIRTELSNESDRANRAEVSLGALQQTIELREAHAEAVVAIRAESQAKIDQIRDDKDDEMEVLEDRERFNRVTIAKPKLVENLSNKATVRVFDDLENTFNQ